MYQIIKSLGLESFEEKNLLSNFDMANFTENSSFMNNYFIDANCISGHCQHHRENFCICGWGFAPVSSRATHLQVLRCDGTLVILQLKQLIYWTCLSVILLMSWDQSFPSNMYRNFAPLFADLPTVKSYTRIPKLYKFLNYPIFM